MTATTFALVIFAVSMLSFGLGWFLSACLFSAGIKDDLATLEAERAELADEREMLNRFWSLDVQPPASDLEWDLGKHRKLSGTVQ